MNHNSTSCLRRTCSFGIESWSIYDSFHPTCAQRERPPPRPTLQFNRFMPQLSWDPADDMTEQKAGDPASSGEDGMFLEYKEKSVSQERDQLQSDGSRWSVMWSIRWRDQVAARCVHSGSHDTRPWLDQSENRWINCIIPQNSHYASLLSSKASRE